MKPEEELCICFHVTRKQVEKFIRLEQPKVVSQCSECYGAGTGCGWCVPFIEKIFEQHNSATSSPVDLELDTEEYLRRRRQYLETTGSGRSAPVDPDAPPLEPKDELVDEIIPD